MFTSQLFAALVLSSVTWALEDNRRDGSMIRQVKSQLHDKAAKAVEMTKKSALIEQHVMDSKIDGAQPLDALKVVKSFLAPGHDGVEGSGVVGPSPASMLELGKPLLKDGVTAGNPSHGRQTGLGDLYKKAADEHVADENGDRLNSELVPYSALELQEGTVDNDMMSDSAMNHVLLDKESHKMQGDDDKKEAEPAKDDEKEGEGDKGNTTEAGKSSSDPSSLRVRTALQLLAAAYVFF